MTKYVLIMKQKGFLQVLISTTSGRYLRCCLLSLWLPINAVQAGLVDDLVNQTGILTIVSPVTTAVGIELDDSVSGLDAGLNGITEPLGLTSLIASDDLLAMDQGLVAAEDDVSVQEFTPLSSAKDQPALVPLTNIDPVFVAGRIQSDAYKCADADGDGVCDQDDQCLTTPRGFKVLANGCYIDGPQSQLPSQSQAKSQPLEGVLFGHDSWALSHAAKLVLDATVAVIQQSDAQRIEVGGYTDTRGSPRYNLRLSESRATAVRNYLVSQGVSAERLVAKGYGELNPRADNNTAAGRELNRRVELKRR